MRVTRHQHHKQIHFDYSLQNQTLRKCSVGKIPSLITWIAEISSKATKTHCFLRRNLAFAPRSTKEVADKTLDWPELEYAAPIWSPYSKLQINQIEKVQRTAARWTCRRWRNTSSVGEMPNELEWPSPEARRDQSSLLLFHKIHCGAVFIEKAKHMTLPGHHIVLSIVETRHIYSDALKNPSSPKLFHIGIVCLPLANTQTKKSLETPHLVKNTAKSLLLIFVYAFFLKISKFALPGIMFKIERASIHRKN